MSQPRLPIMIATAIAGSLFALSASSGVARADQPGETIKSDAHHLAVDIEREAHVVEHRVSSDAHHMRRELATTRERVSLQLHHLEHRIQRWWGRVSTS